MNKALHQGAPDETTYMTVCENNQRAQWCVHCDSHALAGHRRDSWAKLMKPPRAKRRTSFHPFHNTTQKKLYYHTQSKMPRTNQSGPHICRDVCLKTTRDMSPPDTKRLLTSYQTVSVKVAPTGYEEMTHSPLQSPISASGVSAVYSVGSVGEYLTATEGGILCRQKIPTSTVCVQIYFNPF